MKILGFIPAREGSKGIKNKNLVKFNGKPLIFSTINFSKKKKFEWTYNYGIFKNLSQFNQAAYEWLGIIIYYYTGRSAKIF